MNCIIVNDDLHIRNFIKQLIGQNQELMLVASFVDTIEASDFLNRHKIELVFFDFQMHEPNCLEFIKNIPHNTFVVFVSELSFLISKKSNFEETEDSLASKRFQKAVNNAKSHSKRWNRKMTKKRKTYTEDYFMF